MNRSIPQVHCFICGVKFQLGSGGQPEDIELWCQDARFIFNRNQIDFRLRPKVEDPVFPGVTKRGGIAERYTGNSQISLYVYDKYAKPGESINGVSTFESLYRVTPFPLRIFKLSDPQHEDSDGHQDDICSPLHEACWEILVSAAKYSCNLNDDADWVSHLHQLLKHTAWRRYKLYWPHEYGGLETTPSLIYATERPFDEPIRPDDNINDLPRGITIPDFLPLPTEISQQIISYLSLSDISVLRGVGYQKHLEVPDSYWKQLFQPRGEFGHYVTLYPHAQNTSLSAYQIFLFTKQLDRHHKGAQNRKRIWQICCELIDHVLDLTKSTSFNLDSYELTKDYYENIYGYHGSTLPQAFQADSPVTRFKRELQLDPHQTLSVNAHLSVESGGGVYRRLPPFQGSMIRLSGELIDFRADGMVLSFIGSGRMRFVSGITFRPGNQKIGFVNSTRGRLISLASTTTRRLVFSIAATRYGIVGISVTEKAEPCWAANENIADAAIIQRFFNTSESGIAIAELSIKTDISKITNFSISSPNFLLKEELSVTELYIQKRLWAPCLPSIGEHLALMSSYPEDAQNLFNPNHFNPTFHVSFRDKPICRVTAWSMNADLVALEFLLEGEDKPAIMGHPMGSSIDFLINAKAGERLAEVQTLKHESKSASSLLFRTTAGRQCAFIASDPVRHVLRPPQGHVITGIYGRLQKLENILFSRVEWRVVEIGIMSSPYPEASISISSIPMAMTRTNECSVFQGGGLFVSKAAVGNWSAIKLWGRDFPEKRIVGLTIYSSDDDTLRAGNPQILGQIAQAQLVATFELRTNEIPIVIELYHRVVCIAIGVKTSTGRQFLGGIDGAVLDNERGLIRVILGNKVSDVMSGRRLVQIPVVISKIEFGYSEIEL